MPAPAQRPVSVVVTDLDNTLYDWVEIWHRSFSAMFRVVCTGSGVPLEQLLDEIRLVHQRHGTSEYAFITEELQCLRELPPRRRAMILDAANEARRSAREAAMRLYPTVRATLEELRSRGVLLIGYTESVSFYTVRRVRRLGLDGLLDLLYSPPDHELPAGCTHQQVRKHPPEHYQLRATLHRHTPPGERKPNPELLLKILRDAGACPEQAVYVGDSVARDVAMAKAAGVADVHAAYGASHNQEINELLRRVTHWSDAEVVREIAVAAHREVTPTYVLENTFSELLQRLRFAPLDGTWPTWHAEVPRTRHFTCGDNAAVGSARPSGQGSRRCDPVHQ